MKNAIIAAVALAASLLSYQTDCLAQKKPAVDKHGPGEDIYKHYTGTIGTKKVAFDLRWGFQGGSNYGGSSYYTPDGQLTKLIIGQPRSFNHDATLVASELPPDTSITGFDNRDRSHLPKLTFTIGTDKLTGKWHNMDANENYDIALTEDYSNSLPLNVGVYEDTSLHRLPESDKHVAKTNLVYVFPKEGADAKTAKLLHECLLSVTGMAAKGVKDIAKLRLEYNRHFSAECEKKIKAMDSTRAPRPSQKMAIIMPVYNDNGLLVLENEESVWTQSGYKGYYHYTCLDFRKGHIYGPAEILNIDKEPLSKMLEAALRKKYNLDANKPLTAWLKHSTMPVSGNFYPAHKGIVFVYTSDELLDNTKLSVSTFTTQIAVYIPYTELNSMLQKGFKKRVGV